MYFASILLLRDVLARLIVLAEATHMLQPPNLRASQIETVSASTFDDRLPEAIAIAIMEDWPLVPHDVATSLQIGRAHV